MDHSNLDSKIAVNAVAGALFLFASGLAQYASLSQPEPASERTLRARATERDNGVSESITRRKRETVPRTGTRARKVAARSSTTNSKPGVEHPRDLGAQEPRQQRVR